MKVLIKIVITFVLFGLTFFFLVAYPERCQVPIAKSHMAYSHIKALSEAVRQYEKENGKLPKDLNSLAPKHINRVILIDPWGYEYN